MKKCRRQVGIVLKSEEKLQLQLNKHRNIVTKLQVELIKAAGQNDDRRALDLIRKRKRYDQTVEQLEQQLRKHQSISDTIQETVRRIELKIEEARRKKLLLATQRQAFETSRKLSYGLEGHGGDNILDAIEDDLTFLQAETRLSLDIDVDRIGVEELERRLEEHSMHDSEEIPDEEELALLKERITTERETLEALPPAPENSEPLVIGELQEPAEEDPQKEGVKQSADNEEQMAKDDTQKTVEPENTPSESTQEPAKGQPHKEAQVQTTHTTEAAENPEPAHTEPANLTEEDRELARLKRELAEKEAELDALEIQDPEPPVKKEKKPPMVQTGTPVLIIEDDEEEKKLEASQPDILFIDD